MKKRFKLKDFKNGKIQISDNFALPTESTRVLTEEGYLKATACVTKIGVQMYSARDFGIDSDDPIGVLRPSETVFHPETIESLKMKPIVLLHPEQDVDSTNHSRLSVGNVGETVEAIDGERLGASIQITDDSVVKQILAREIEELSLGYDVFIISEEGSFNGEKYLYKMDGPMLNNHLAIVPQGRCGDTVKILDQGGSKVNWKKFLKILKDAGVSEERIKVIMADAKETDDVDMTLVIKALSEFKKVNDIDMTALVPAIVAELKPQIEEIIKTPEFTSSLAKEIAAGMSGASTQTEGGEVDADPGEEEGEEPMTKEALDAAIKDGAASRAKLIDKATPFIKKDDSFDIHKAKDRDILEKALEAVGIKPETMKDQSDEYLLGILDTISKDRKDSKLFRNKDWSVEDNGGLTKPMNGISARKI